MAETNEVERLRDALTAIAAKWADAHESWHPGRSFPTEASRNWHDGFVTALATVHEMARKALDPAGEHAAEERWRSGLEASDAEWFTRTGNVAALVDRELSEVRDLRAGLGGIAPQAVGLAGRADNHTKARLGGTS